MPCAWMTKIKAKRGDEEAAELGELKRLRVGEAAQGNHLCSSRFAFLVPLSLAEGGSCAISSSPRTRRESS